MNSDAIETVLWESRLATMKHAPHGATWWPRTQGEASAWAAAFFLTAARRELPDLKGLSVSAAWDKNVDRRKLLSALWEEDGGEFWPHEAMLDFSVHDWNKNEPFLITGESEVHPYHGVLDSLTSIDDYSWDFFKLLTVPSRLRLFFAFVGTQVRLQSIESRIGQLETSIRGIVQAYGKHLLRSEDRLAVVLIAATKESAMSSRTLSVMGSDLRVDGRATNIPALWKRDL